MYIKSLIISLCIIFSCGCDSSYDESDFKSILPFKGSIVKIKIMGYKQNGLIDKCFTIRYGAEGFSKLTIKNKSEIWYAKKDLIIGKKVNVPFSFQ